MGKLYEGISKEDDAKLDAKIAELKEYESEVDAIKKQLEDVLVKINTTRQEIWAILDDMANQAELAYDEMSEKWQESDKGEAYQEWLGELRMQADACDEEVVAEIEGLDLDELITAIEGDLPRTFEF